MIKHTPATPLPWEPDEEASVCGSNTMVASTRRRNWPEQPWQMDQDAAYIAHAANAYPKLVEALRFTMKLCEHSSIFYQSAEQVLRELGEED